MVLRRPVETAQYLSIKYTERLAQAEIDLSVGTVGDAYDNALAECVIGLFKTEVINQIGLVAYLCRSKCSFRPLCVRRPRGFFLPVLNADGAGYRSR